MVRCLLTAWWVWGFEILASARTLHDFTWTTFLVTIQLFTTPSADLIAGTGMREFRHSIAAFSSQSIIHAFTHPESRARPELLKIHMSQAKRQ